LGLAFSEMTWHRSNNHLGRDSLSGRHILPAHILLNSSRLLREGYLPEQVYNADETGIYYKMLPDKMLAVKSNEHRKEGFKAIKERLTLLFCVKKTGSHKLKPLCIGKSCQPRRFHHINLKSLPFVYVNSKNA